MYHDFTTRPLSLHELRWALLVESDCPHRLLDENQKAEGGRLISRRQGWNGETSSDAQLWLCRDKV